MNESQGSEAGDLAMPFRYEVVPDQTKISNTFRPNSMGPNFDPETHKPATLGCAFMGQLHRVARQQQNDKVAVLWEARPRASKSLYSDGQSVRTSFRKIFSKISPDLEPIPF